MSKPDPTPEATPAAPASPPPAHGGSFILDPVTGERRLQGAPAVVPEAVVADPPEPAPVAAPVPVEPPQKGTRK